MPKKEASQIDVILASELGQEFEEIVVAITFLHIWLEVKLRKNDKSDGQTCSKLKIRYM